MSTVAELARVGPDRCRGRARFRRVRSRSPATVRSSRSRRSATRPTETRFAIFSATKPIVASAVWLLIGDGLLDVQRPRRRLHPRVRHARQGRRHRRASDAPHGRLPEPAAAGRGRRSGGSAAVLRRVAARVGAGIAVRVPRRVGALGAGRAHRAARRLSTSATSSRARVTTPLGLPRVLGIPDVRQHECADSVAVGDGASLDDVLAVARSASDPARPAIPGGGAFMTAAELAAFYQGLSCTTRRASGTTSCCAT